MVHQLIANSVKDSPIRPGQSKPAKHTQQSKLRGHGGCASSQSGEHTRSAHRRRSHTADAAPRFLRHRQSAPNWHRAPQRCPQTGRCPHRPARILPCPARPHRSVVGKHGTDVAQRETCPSTRRDAGLCSPVRAPVFCGRARVLAGRHSAACRVFGHVGLARAHSYLGGRLAGDVWTRGGARGG